MFYDTLIVMAILIIGTVFSLFLTQGKPIPPHTFYYQFFLTGLWASFFIGFWSRGGQTIGLRAWHLKVVTWDDQNLSFKQAAIRLLLATLLILLGGIGLVWSLFDKQGLTLYDRLSKTKLIDI